MLAMGELCSVHIATAGPHSRTGVKLLSLNSRAAKIFFFWTAAISQLPNAWRADNGRLGMQHSGKPAPVQMSLCATFNSTGGLNDLQGITLCFHSNFSGNGAVD